MQLQKVAVDLGVRGYPVYIGSGIQNEIYSILERGTAVRKVFVVTDKSLYSLFAANFVETLKGRGWDVHGITIEPGEKHKTYEEAMRIVSELVKYNYRNDSLVIGLGGGSIADLVGFAAAQYLSGIPYIIIPTTFAAMIDGAIGGYHAVNHMDYKDQLSCVWEPKAVICDVAYLRSLSSQEYANGIAELIKFAIVHDPALFSYLESNLVLIKNLEVPVVCKIISRVVSLKALYIKADEGNKGAQLALDLGHTVGHALETTSSFHLSHGEAVSIGILVAARVSKEMRQLTNAEYYKIKALFTEAGLPTSISDCNRDALMDAIMHDRKANDGTIKYTIPLKIGRAVVSEKITLGMINQVLEED